MRRLRFENEALAAAVINALAQAMDGKASARRVGADEFLRIAGAP